VILLTAISTFPQINISCNSIIFHGNPIFNQKHSEEDEEELIKPENSLNFLASQEESKKENAIFSPMLDQHPSNDSSNQLQVYFSPQNKSKQILIRNNFNRVLNYVFKNETMFFDIQVSHVMVANGC
jgi:hypothetical protein